MEELRKQIIEELERKLGEGYEITPCDKSKNNGLILHGICIHKEDESVSPVVYVESFIRNDGVKDPAPGEIADTILKEMCGYEIPRNVADNVRDILEIKERIRLRLVNYDANRKELENLPHRKFLDLAVVYYLDLEPIAGQCAFAAITNKLMEEWGVTEDELYRLSMEKLLTEDGCKVSDMLDVLRELIQAQEDAGAEMLLPELSVEQSHPKMYVASNKKKLFGAGCLLNISLLQDLAERSKSSLIIFPSSIHELIIIPQINESETYLGTKEVQEINTNEVIREECLSNSIYRYDREKQEVSIFQMGAQLSW